MKSEQMKIYLEKEVKEQTPYTFLEEDLDIVLRQVIATRQIAKETLIRNNGDIVKTIIELFN